MDWILVDWNWLLSYHNNCSLFSVYRAENEENKEKIIDFG